MRPHDFAMHAVVAPPFNLVEELSQRVVDDYAEAISCLSQAARSADASAQEALACAAGRLRAHAEIHQALLPPTATGMVNLADHIGRICKTMSKASLAENLVHIALKADEIGLRGDRCWRIGLIIAELIRNAARHGLSGGPGAIVVQLLKRPDDIVCVVHDNGRGSEECQPVRALRLVRSIASELGGTVVWRFTTRGAQVWLKIPSEQPAH